MTKEADVIVEKKSFSSVEDIYKESQKDDLKEEKRSEDNTDNKSKLPVLQNNHNSMFIPKDILENLLYSNDYFNDVERKLILSIVQNEYYGEIDNYCVQQLILTKLNIRIFQAIEKSNSKMFNELQEVVEDLKTGFIHTKFERQLSILQSNKEIYEELSEKADNIQRTIQNSVNLFNERVKLNDEYDALQREKEKLSEDKAVLKLQKKISTVVMYILIFSLFIAGFLFYKAVNLNRSIIKQKKFPNIIWAERDGHIYVRAELDKSGMNVITAVNPQNPDIVYVRAYKKK